MAAKITHSWYASVSEALADAKAPYQKSENAKAATHYLTKTDGNYSFNGGASEVIASFFSGNEEAEKKVRAFHDEFVKTLPRAVGIRRAITRGSMGDELDIHAVNRGDLDRAWTKRERQLKRGSSILRLCVDICGNAGQSGDSLSWRGIAALSLSEIMTKAGYSVEIIAAIAVSDYSNNESIMTASTVIKPRSTTADIGLLAATIATAGFFRTVGFCQIIREADKHGRVASGGLGSYREASGLLPVQDKITQLTVDGNVNNRTSAKKWITQSLQLLQG